MNESLRAQLLSMQADDLDTRRRLIEAGQLYGPHLPRDFYHPDMAAVHRRNHAQMRAIIDQYGWPGQTLVGEERRAAMGLPPLAEHTAHLQKRVAVESQVQKAAADGVQAGEEKSR